MRTDGVTVAALFVLAATAAAACGGATTVVGGQGSIGSEPRVATSMEHATEVAGHPIALEIDSAITASRPREDVDRMIASAADAVAHDLSVLKMRDPEVFAGEVPHLARIACRFREGGAHEVHWEGTTLAITSSARWQVLAEGDVADALRDDFYGALARRFNNVEPEQVAPADRQDYFVYLVHGTTGDDDDGSRRTPVADAVVARVLRFAALVGASDTKLAAAARGWLLARSGDMASGDPSSETPERKQTRAAWVRWLGASLPSASAVEKLKVARAAFPDPSSYGYAQRKTTGDAIEGFDSFAFGLSIADAWIAAGHPAEHIDDPAHALWQLILDPPLLDNYGKLPRFNYGSSAWLRTAFEVDPQGRRLADALTARNDPQLVGAVLYSLPRGTTQVPDPRANLLQQLARTPNTWRLAMVLLIGQGMAGDGCGSGLVDEANRVWHEAPALRGTALHVIACKEGRARGISDQYFLQFPRLYGQPVGAALFGAFLDDGPDAMRLADTLWPAMSAGWSRAAVIAPRLDAFLADPRVRAGDDGEPMQTLDRLTQRLCADGPAEVARLHDALAARARKDVAEARALARVLDDTAAGRCAHK